MPARKSNASAVSAAEDGSAPAPPQKEKEHGKDKDKDAHDGTSVEDLALPRTMIQRLAKGVLPPNTQIQKDALLAMSKSATVFVNYLTSHANDNALRANKKTIQPKDVMDAMSEIEFEAFLPRLEAELTKYNAIQCDKRNTYRRKVREEKKTQPGQPATGDGENGSASAMAVDSQHTNGDAEPAAKKIRAEDGTATVNGLDNDDEVDEAIEAQNQDAEEENEEEMDEDEEEEDEQQSDPEDELLEDPIEVGGPRPTRVDSDVDESD